MIKIVDNDIYRAGDKIGYVRGNDVFNHDGVKVGFYTSNDIYDSSGRKLGYIQGDHIFEEDGDKYSISSNREHVRGGTLSDMHRAAIRLLLGD